MLKVTVELAPAAGGAPRKVALMTVTNDHSGDETFGNYDVVLTEHGKRSRILHVEGVARNQSVWDFIATILGGG